MTDNAHLYELVNELQERVQNLTERLDKLEPSADTPLEQWWKGVPQVYMFAARDKDGRWFTYKSEPVLADGEWRTYTMYRILEESKLPPVPDGHWKESLLRRR